MAKPQAPTDPSPFAARSEIAPKDYLLPDEDPDAYLQLVAETLDELVPRSPYERRLAVNLAQIEWELARHRRLLAAAVRTGFREQAIATGKHRTPGHDPANFLSHDDTTGLSYNLLSDDPVKRQKGDDRLKDLQVTRSEITAAAYHFACEQISWHESRISDLERRRRILRSDFMALRGHKVLPPSIIEAEVLK
jgi:hypothetical protein